jgi:hypothetical protein
MANVRWIKEIRALLLIFLSFQGDLHFGDVKLADVPAWIARRDKTPMGVYQGGIRTFWKFYRAYLDNKKPNLIWYTQIFFVASLFNFIFYAIPDRSKFFSWLTYLPIHWLSSRTIQMGQISLDLSSTKNSFSFVRFLIFLFFVSHRSY